MFKRYIILTIALSFMAVSVPKCPFGLSAKAHQSHFAQGPEVTHQTAATQTAAPRL